MFQPIISNNARQRESFLNSFGGLNRKEYATENELSDMENLSSDKFPHISVRKSRDVAKNLVNSGGLIMENGEYIAHINPFYDECLVMFNGTALRFPNGNIGNGFTLKSGQSVYASTTVISGSISENRLSLTSGTWDKYFKVGDRISISGSKNQTYEVNGNKIPYDESIDTFDGEDTENADEYAIVSCIVESINEADMYVRCYNKNGEEVQLIYCYNSNFKDATIRQLIPSLTDACVLNNRIFGVAESGKYIYACKMGDYKSWYTYEGISTDSWYGEVGTDGKFTGIIEYNGSVIAFKRDYIYKIYGDNPKNFTIQKQSSDGCIDKKSIVGLNGRLYFLSQNGFCVYSGGYPTIISETLNKRYKNATGGTDGRKIYFYATADDGTKEMLVYDTTLNMWHLEDTDNTVSAFFRHNGELYFSQGTDNKIYKMNGNGHADKWHFRTQEQNTLGMNYTLLSDIAFYASSAEKSKSCVFNVYIMYDGAEESEKAFCGSFMLAPNTTQRIPINLKPCFSYSILVEGTGPIVIKSIERSYTAGGRNEGNRR